MAVMNQNISSKVACFWNTLEEEKLLDLNTEYAEFDLLYCSGAASF